MAEKIDRAQQELNQREWENLDNWTLPVGIYFSKRDSRWLVPKKNTSLGWTLNMATQTGAWAFIAAFLIPIVMLSGALVVAALSAGCR